MLLCRAVHVLACWDNISNCYEQIESEIILFAMCSFECLCSILEFCQVHYPEGKYPPLHKNASQSTLGVNVKSLENSMDCATELTGWHLQDNSCISRRRGHATRKWLPCRI